MFLKIIVLQPEPVVESVDEEIIEKEEEEFSEAALGRRLPNLLFLDAAASAREIIRYAS